MKPELSRQEKLFQEKRRKRHGKPPEEIPNAGGCVVRWSDGKVVIDRQVTAEPFK